VASLSAPSLFLIAKDLRNMQVWVAVNEADIGRIHPGQPVNFTVDAYPGQAFRGTVNKIRLNASMTQNVVTYTVEVNTDNSDGKLLPYLSATVNFEVARHENVLTVPNTALNWNPPAELGIVSVQLPIEHKPAAMDDRDQDENRPKRNEHGKKDNKQGQSPKPISQPAETQTGTIWVIEDEDIRPINVTIGGSDGTNTQITNPDLREGMAVVIGQEIAAAGSDGTVNPFAPKFFSRSRRSGRSQSGTKR
jgi:HlyD family secretion protein